MVDIFHLHLGYEVDVSMAHHGLEVRLSLEPPSLIRSPPQKRAPTDLVKDSGSHSSGNTWSSPLTESAPFRSFCATTYLFMLQYLYFLFRLVGLASVQLVR